MADDELIDTLDNYGIEYIHIRHTDGKIVVVTTARGMDVAERLVRSEIVGGLYVCRDEDGSWRAAGRMGDGSVAYARRVTERIAYRTILGGYRIGTTPRHGFGVHDLGNGNKRYLP